MIIKFRGWDKFMEEMFYDLESVYCDNVWNKDRTVSRHATCFGEFFIDDDITIEQYIGINDKNKTPIYIGDIVRIISETAFWSVGDKPLEPFIKNYEIVFHDGKFCLFYRLEDLFGSEGYYFDLKYDGNDIEIIGNIHEGIDD